MAPKITGGSDCVDLTGSFIAVKDLHVDDCGYAGISLRGDDNRIEGVRMTGNVAGVYVRSGASGNKILDSDLIDNDKMSDSECGGPGDSGAFGILLHGDQTEIARNERSGSNAYSCEYGRDGAAVEVYGGSDNDVHHNLAVDNDIFTELGEAGSANNTFAYNVVRSSLTDSRFLVTRGAEGSRGPVLATKVYNNSVRLTGATSQGFVCHDGCSSAILRMRNNVFEAVEKAGYADGAFDEDYDLFFGGETQFTLGANSLEADPRFAAPASGDLRLQSSSPAVDPGGGARRLQLGLRR